MEIWHAYTPLSLPYYEEQVSKKSKEARWVAQQLANEITTANPATKNWVEFQTQKYVFRARVQGLKESPVLDGYRNKCEFAIWANPGARRLTVGLTVNRHYCWSCNLAQEYDFTWYLLWNGSNRFESCKKVLIGKSLSFIRPILKFHLLGSWCW